ncbi:MAG TPA: acyl-CoA desaturase [Bacteroidia bacterium]|nr:acyl-CoA desaturase [Bacteroidia bacterium]
MSETAKIQFNTQQRLFFQTLHKRVDQYFKTNEISKNGNTTMVVKTFCMFALYFVPYFLLIFNVFSSAPILLFLSVMMGFGVAGIGLSVMHDANHGSYSKNKRVNKIMSWSISLIGGHALNWQLQHNTLHHTFTNIDGHDEDIDAMGLMRFSPHAPYKKIHRFQYLYAWFFYGLMTISWVIKKDFVKLKKYETMGLLAAKNKKYTRELFILILCKMFYYTYMLVIPMLMMKQAWWQIMIGFAIIHYTGGLLLALVFQPAHVVEDIKYPLPDQSGNMENDWAVHQLYTTSNFAPNAKLLSWFVGGLNFQVEHHLFPTICHVHYKKIAPIVKQTAAEFNYPYHSQKTFVKAIATHARMLIELGKGPEVAAV